MNTPDMLCSPPSPDEIDLLSFISETGCGAPQALAAVAENRLPFRRVTLLLIPREQIERWKSGEVAARAAFGTTNAAPGLIDSGSVGKARVA
jgi:hypothetical protein